MNENVGIAGQNADGEIPAVPALPNDVANPLPTIAQAFNNARGIENQNLCPGGVCEGIAQVMPIDLAFPADYMARSVSERALFLLNSERVARGLLPFTGVDAAVVQNAQTWAQHLVDENSFHHQGNPHPDGSASPGARAAIEAICNGCVGNIGLNAAENLSSRAAYSLPNRAILDGFGLERAFYGWMYEDRVSGGQDQRWGHRHALLWNNQTNDNGPATSEGFIGLGVAKANDTCCGGFLGEREIVVWVAIDSNGNYPPVQANPGFVPLTAPCPVYDSSTATGGLAGVFNGGESRNINVTGALPAAQGVGTGTCVPAGSGSVMLTVTALGPQAGGNLRLSAAGVVPQGGVVNYANNGLNNTNTVTVALSGAGQMAIQANGGAGGQGLPSTGVRIAIMSGTIPPAGGDELRRRHPVRCC